MTYLTTASYPGAFTPNPVLYIQISDKDSQRPPLIARSLSFSLICIYNTGLSVNAPGYEADLTNSRPRRGDYKLILTELRNGEFYHTRVFRSPRASTLGTRLDYHLRVGLR